MNTRAGGGVTMVESICSHNDNGYDGRYRLMLMARAQDAIGWRCFVEGKVCREIRLIQMIHTALSGSRANAEKWSVELITKPLQIEVMHGQWLYHSVRGDSDGNRGAAGSGDSRLIRCRLPLGSMQSGRPQSYLRDKRNLLATGNQRHT